MSIEKNYVSDITGDRINGKPRTITLTRTERKKATWGSGYYNDRVTKGFHIAEDEISLLPEKIREFLFPTPKVAKVKAKA